MDEIIFHSNVKIGSRKPKLLGSKSVVMTLLRRNGALLLEKSSGSKRKVVAELNSSVECVTLSSEDDRKVVVKFRHQDISTRALLELRTTSPQDSSKWHRILVEMCNCPGVEVPKTPRPRQLSVTSSRFAVNMLPASTVDIYGPCRLEVTGSAIVLLDISDERKQLLQWPLTCLRYYGSGDDKFHFESGRSCETGEGLFAFMTKDGARICATVHEQSLRLAEHSRRQHTIGAGGVPQVLPAATLLPVPSEAEYLPVSEADGAYLQPHPDVPAVSGLHAACLAASPLPSSAGAEYLPVLDGTSVYLEPHSDVPAIRAPPRPPLRPSRNRRQ